MKILVLCTGNSCRSQMAEGFFRQYLNKSDKIKSAGLEPHGVNPLAIQVMNEVGIDISCQTSNHINEYLEQQFDYIITVCDNAAANCPTFPGGGSRIHWSFEDPAQATGTEEDVINKFRHIRNEIENKIKEWVDNLH
ncbi:MAG: arsenate reductase ArsC [Candidatus Zixiibacteriota bacterium]